MAIALAPQRKIVIPRLQKQGKRIQLMLYAPHAAQIKMHSSKARFRVGAWGRRCGKTICALNEEVKFGCDHPGSNCVWIAPVYRQCRVVYRALKKALKEIIVASSDSELRMEIVGGTVFSFYSATNPDTIRGEEFSFAVLDECGDIAEEVWTEAVRPLLMKTNGKAIFIGTPKGRNWFYTIFERGQDPLEEEWDSFHFPTSANPYIPTKEIEAAKRDLPEAAFEQEILAIFREDGAGVFRGIDKCIQGSFEEIVPNHFYISIPPQPDFTYVVGFDVAKYQDFSVMSVLNTHTMHLDAFYRTQQTEYLHQIKQLKVITDLYNGAAVMQDATGVGDAVLEMVRAEGITAEGYVYGNLSKKILIEGLQLAIEHQNISYPDIPVMIGELRLMQYNITPGRFITYSAPHGKHDDTVNSLALANYAAMSGGVALVPEGNDEISLLDENNEQLLDRQLNMADLLGGVELVASYGGDLW